MPDDRRPAFHVTYDESYSAGSGVASFASWKNPDLTRALRAAFGCRENEKIIGLRVDEMGITATFRRST